MSKNPDIIRELADEALSDALELTTPKEVEKHLLYPMDTEQATANKAFQKMSPRGKKLLEQDTLTKKDVRQLKEYLFDAVMKTYPDANSADMKRAWDELERQLDGKVK